MQKRAIVIFLFFIAGLMFTDLYLLTKDGYEATLSASIFQFSRDYPVIPFIGGILLGHVLWPNEYATKKKMDSGGDGH